MNRKQAAKLTGYAPERIKAQFGKEADIPYEWVCAVILKKQMDQMVWGKAPIIPSYAFLTAVVVAAGLVDNYFRPKKKRKH